MFGPNQLHCRTCGVIAPSNSESVADASYRTLAVAMLNSCVYFDELRKRLEFPTSPEQVWRNEHVRRYRFLNSLRSGSVSMGS